MFYFAWYCFRSLVANYFCTDSIAAIMALLQMHFLKLVLIVWFKK